MIRSLRAHTLMTALAAGLLLAPSAKAGVKECISAADEGQKQRDEGHLASAREKFISCAAKSCPSAIARQCSEWLSEVERDMPSVSFRALDERGKETLDVTVSVDGAVVASNIGARAHPLDPGEHTVRFVRATGGTLETKVVLRPGERNRIIELSFQPKVPATPAPAVAPVATAPPSPKTKANSTPERAFHVPVLGWIGLGLAAGGGAATTLLVISASSDERHLRQTCAPSCDRSEQDKVDTKILAANIGLGVGIAGLGLAIVSTIFANTGHKATSKSARSSPDLAVDVTSNAVLLRGAF